MEQEMELQTGALSGVMQGLYKAVVYKRGLNQKTKLSNYQSIYVCTRMNSHRFSVVTERTNSGIQVGKLCFLRRLSGFP